MCCFETDHIEFIEGDIKSILGKYKANIGFKDKAILLTFNAKANYKRANGQLQIIAENDNKNSTPNSFIVTSLQI